MMNQEERKHLQDDLDYFQSVFEAIQKGLFTGVSSGIILAILHRTEEKISGLREKLTAENMRIQKLLDESEQGGKNGIISSSTTGTRRQPISAARSKNAK